MSNVRQGDHDSMTEFRLYCFAQSGNAYKAALMLNLCDASWVPRHVDYFRGQTRTAEFRQLNELGEVPVLEHGELVLSQSGVILDYLADHFGRFRASTPEQRREVLRWLLWDNHKFTSYIATLRYLLQFEPDRAEPAVIEFLRGRALNALGILDRHLDRQPFVAGAELTIADLSACGYLFWPGEFGVDWSDYPAIGDWLGRIRAVPGWRHPYDLMPGHPMESAAGTT